MNGVSSTPNSAQRKSPLNAGFFFAKIRREFSVLELAHEKLSHCLDRGNAAATQQCLLEPFAAQPADPFQALVADQFAAVVQ